MTNRNESRRPRAQAGGLDTHAVICDHGRRRVAPPLVIRPEGPGCARLRALTLSHAVGVLRLPQLRQIRQVDRVRFTRYSTSIDIRFPEPIASDVVRAHAPPRSGSDVKRMTLNVQTAPVPLAYEYPGVEFLVRLRATPAAGGCERRGKSDRGR